MGWELTVCNSLYDEQSPCRRALMEPVSFGEALYSHLKKLIPLQEITNIVEVGGGYGNLMVDFLRLKPDLHVTMIDISPEMHRRQKEVAGGSNVQFVLADFFDISSTALSSFELAIFNEIMGDFPTACDVETKAIVDNLSDENELIARIKDDFRKYNFPIPQSEFFNYNIGAIRAVEKLCEAGMPFAYIGEHSCESRLQKIGDNFCKLQFDGYSTPIRLLGHTEYTIKFSHLVRVAHQYGYKVHRGCFEDFLNVKWSDEVRFIMNANTIKEEHEIIRQFVEDLFTYEYLVLIKQS
ncbi:MAG: class I SAM-dependent methyltransferase [Spirochaetes bacterium]|nr:class I SAM-dependent methyltransferase [Spirochaetota bacterium]